MLVCLCKAVSDHKVKEAISAGARSVKEIAQTCRAGTGRGCGACRDSLRALIETESGGQSACKMAGQPGPSAR